MSASPSRATGARLGSLPPKSWTIVAWAAVAAASVILTYLITLALGLALTGFGFLVALATISRVSFVGILLAAFALIVGVTVLWSLVPRDGFAGFGGNADRSLARGAVAGRVGGDRASDGGADAKGGVSDPGPERGGDAVPR